MIVQEEIIINGKKFLYTYSSLGYKISREGKIYDDAADPIDLNREYKETTIKLEEGLAPYSL